MKIGESAKAAHVEVETIRYYERIGLLPAPARSQCGAPDRAAQCGIHELEAPTPGDACVCHGERPQ